MMRGSILAPLVSTFHYCIHDEVFRRLDFQITLFLVWMFRSACLFKSFLIYPIFWNLPLLNIYSLIHIQQFIEFGFGFKQFSNFTLHYPFDWLSLTSLFMTCKTYTYCHIFHLVWREKKKHVFLKVGIKNINKLKQKKKLWTRWDLWKL